MACSSTVKSEKCIDSKPSRRSTIKRENEAAWRRIADLPVAVNPYTELIILDEPPAFESHRHHLPNHEKSLNTRVIELSDMQTKMELRREFKVDEIDGSVIKDNIDSEILLPKLPAGTILIKQNSEVNKLTEVTRESAEPIAGRHKPNRQEKIRTVGQTRRNPTRGTKVKSIENNFRPRLLAIKRRGNVDELNAVKRQMKSSNIPYMNTRSVTKKLYNVGATYQSPTNDEIEWKEWPVHGMNERPIYHPQMGLAVDIMGRTFVSLDNCCYQEFPQSSDFQVVIPDSDNISREWRTSGKTDESFENCMHESLHSVLAYSAQIMKPAYRKLFDNSRDVEIKLTSATTNRSTEIPKLQAIKPPINLKCIKNHAKLQQVLERGSKNTLILLKTSDPGLKKDKEVVVNSSMDIVAPVKSDRDSTESENLSKPTDLVHENFKYVHGDMNDRKKTNLTSNNKSSDASALRTTKDIVDETNMENWLQELITDTAVLYCTASGIHQDDFVHYLDSLCPRQCISWPGTGY